MHHVTLYLKRANLGAHQRVRGSKYHSSKILHLLIVPILIKPMVITIETLVLTKAITVITELQIIIDKTHLLSP